MNDSTYMKQALALAQMGNGHVTPNPMVGAVIVKNSLVIGEGFHKKYGGPHAEIEALSSCSDSPDGATMYVTLEPCCHTKKQTPPCVGALIRAGLKKVVISSLDPNPLVCGKGVEELRRNGLIVEHGILETEENRLNERYRKFITTGLPFIHLKIAQTLDGKMAAADSSSKWITCEASRKTVHEWRGRYGAVAVGAETLRTDDPSLTIRHGLQDHYLQPWRVIIAGSRPLPPESKCFRDEFASKTIVLVPEGLAQHELGVKVITVPAFEGKILLNTAIKILGELKIQSLLVEGGPTLHSSFIKAKLVDKISFFVAPKILGLGAPSVGDIGISNISKALTLREVSTEISGEDFIFSGYPQMP